MTDQELFDNMMVGVHANNPEEVEHWLMQNPAIINMRDKNGWSAVDWSANEGFIDTMRVLLKYNGLAQFLNANNAHEEVQ
jgi:ankyrin repeat protein